MLTCQTSGTRSRAGLRPETGRRCQLSVIPHTGPQLPLCRQPLRLAADPRSVRTARRWIAARFSELDRGDLSECAQLGISELVTNALLHGSDPIAVRIRGTHEHPRVEVTDGSVLPPVLPGPAGDGFDDLMATFGRGLGIVARCSTAWGATIESRGKVVWFEPAPQQQEQTPPRGSVLLPEEAASSAQSRADQVPIRLLGLPVATTLGLLRHHRDLRREVRLLAFAHADTYPLAGELTRAFTRCEEAYPASIASTVDRAAANGVESVDLNVHVSKNAVPNLREMLELLALADEFCRAERLLSLARSEHQRDFQEWLLGEFVGQSEGKDPVRWPRRRTDVPTGR